MGMKLEIIVEVEVVDAAAFASAATDSGDDPGSVVAALLERAAVPPLAGHGLRVSAVNGNAVQEPEEEIRDHDGDDFMDADERAQVAFLHPF